jgi:hypothetical protein
MFTRVLAAAVCVALSGCGTGAHAHPEPRYERVASGGVERFYPGS